MKILFLVRHAKSSWKYPALSDMDRPLNKRGWRDAPEMGRRLAIRGNAPELLMTSPAVRAIRTAEAIARAIEYPLSRMVLDDKLYHGNPNQMLDVIKSLDETLTRVMLVGHNPALTDTVNYLATSRIDNVPTSGVVELKFDVSSWNDLQRDSLKSFYFDYPKKQP